MPTAWRIVKKRHAESAFDGEGARQYGGRWNSPGSPVAYASDTRALCLLEVLAGLGSVSPLPGYVLIPATFDDSLVLPVPQESLPSDWRQSPPPPSTQRIGDEWVNQARSALLRVPSVIVPDEHNYLLNPAHPDFRHIRIGSPEEITIDSRLLR
jgi:RES domain-containing protein